LTTVGKAIYTSFVCPLEGLRY